MTTLGMLALTGVVMAALLGLVIRFDVSARLAHLGAERRTRRQAAQLLHEIEDFRRG